MSLSPLSSSQRTGISPLPNQPLSQAEHAALALIPQAQGLASKLWVSSQLIALRSSHPKVREAIKQLEQESERFGKEFLS
jgi:hypothetical protein